MPERIRKLFAHLVWADDRVLDALSAAPAIEPVWLELFGHILGAEHVWLARLREEPATVAVWPALSVEQCRALARETRAGYDMLLAGLDPAGLGRLISYRNSAGQDFRSSVEDILLHVALHGSYHRGQVASLMRRGGAAPAATDYIAYVRGVPAAPRRPPDR